MLFRSHARQRKAQHIPYWNLLGFALTCVYVSMAVRWAEPRPLSASPYPPMQYQQNPYAAPLGGYPPQYPPPGQYQQPPAPYPPQGPPPAV